MKGWKASAAWGFPKGKINQDEPERDCAVREVLEETGFDCSSLLPTDSPDFLELTMREQKIRLYIVPGVCESTHFEALTRKEISVGGLSAFHRFVRVRLLTMIFALLSSRKSHGSS